jgi:ubiquinone/menaquinone biosynthesis C-methylase UbiE
MHRRGRMGNTAFRMMSVIHDNPLRRALDSPYKSLEAAGLQPGQQVLEVGSGPGFFTVPAAEMVGENGHLYVVDIHPLAIRAAEEKLRGTALTNVTVTLADAAETGLPDDGIDLVFLFGVIHGLPLDRVLPELHRVLKPGGIMAVEGGGSSNAVTEGGLFTFVGSQGRIFRYAATVDGQD